jgi:Ca-activated chloride channel homolog
MRIANPLMLILLLIPLAVWFFYLWVQRKTSRDLASFAHKDVLARVVDFEGQKLRNQRWILRLIIFTLLVFALAGPQWGYQWQVVKHQGLEIVFALDTSKSMLATDVKPSRLERSKLAVTDLLNKLHGDKVGLVAFAGSSFLQCPLTLDYSAFAMAINDLTVQVIPRGGTALGDAIQTARQAFQAGSTGSKILVLISDGENHEGDPVASARTAVKDGITIYTIGIGSPTGELIVTKDANDNSSYLKDSSGNVVKTTLDEQMLREIASAGNGFYIKGTGLSLGLDDLYRLKLLKLSQGEVSSKLQKSYLERYQIPLLLAILLLVLELLIGTKLQWGFDQKKPIIAPVESR